MKKDSHSKRNHMNVQDKAKLIKEMHMKRMQGKKYYQVGWLVGIDSRTIDRWLDEYTIYLATGRLPKGKTRIKKCIPYFEGEPQYISILWGRVKIKVG